MNKVRLIISILSLALLFSGLSLLRPYDASALLPNINPSTDIVGLEFYNSSRVYLELRNVSGQTRFGFTDQNPSDDTYGFTRTDNNCTSEIRFSSNPTSNPTQFTLTWQYATGTGGCRDGATTVVTTTITGTERASWDAYWINDSEIFMPRFRVRTNETLTGWTNNYSSNGIFRHFPTDVSGYDDDIYPRWVSGANFKGYTFEAHVDETRHAATQWIETNYSGSRHRQRAKACYRTSIPLVGSHDECDTKSWDITIAPRGTTIPSIYGVSIDEDGNASIPEFDDTAAGPDPDSCEVRSKTPLSWILCPALNGIGKGIELFRHLIEQALNFNLTDDSDGSNSLRTAWGTFRNMANVLFIIAFLFIIISQTLSGRF